MEPAALNQWVDLLGKDGVRVAESDRHCYSYDNSRLSIVPQAVLLPRQSEQIPEIVAICRHYRIPLTVRGRGTCTTGAAVPTESGVVVSMEHLRTILRTDPANRLMVVQPGVTNQEVQQEAARHGFFWAPDPGSAPFCSVGGNIACGSAGPRAVKYGTVRENVLGLQGVTGAGEWIRTGVATTKWAVGHDLTRLLIGTEGTLAITTEATLKLLPQQPARRMMRALYDNITAAGEAVAAIMAQPHTPCALEFLDGASLALIRDRLGSPLPPTTAAMLMIEVDGSDEAVQTATDSIEAAAACPGLLEFHQTDHQKEAEQLWQARKILSPRLREIAPKKINEDIVVPVSAIPEMIETITQLAQQHQIQIATFGHAGNGNLHTNLLVDPTHQEELSRADQCLEQLFQKVLELNGTLSGEHGVGRVKARYVERELGESERRLMAGIKRLFDPDHILNPDIGFPSR